MQIRLEMQQYSDYKINDLAQECGISIAIVLEIPESWAKTSNWF